MGTNYYLRKRNGESFSVVNPLNELSFINRILYYDNYTYLYVRDDVEEVKDLHIGKSSLGWHFALCIYPSLGIYSLSDWYKYFTEEYYVIDEYDIEVSFDSLLDTIVNRKAIKFDSYDSIEEYEKYCLENINKVEHNEYNTYDEFLKKNNYTRGKNGLLAHSTHLIKFFDTYIFSVYVNTEGTYDYTFQYDFS